MHFSESGSVALVICMIFITAGTILFSVFTLLAFAVNHKLRTYSDYFIVNLSFADLSVGLLAMPFSIPFVVTGDWILGTAFCFSWLSVNAMVTTTSAYCICVITIDRFLLVDYPAWYINNKKTWLLTAMLFSPWIGAMLLNGPPRMMLEFLMETLSVPKHACFQPYLDLHVAVVDLCVSLCGPLILILFINVVVRCRLTRGTGLPSTPVENPRRVPQASSPSSAARRASRAEEHPHTGTEVVRETVGVISADQHITDWVSANSVGSVTELEVNQSDAKKAGTHFLSSQNAAGKTESCDSPTFRREPWPVSHGCSRSSDLAQVRYSTASGDVDGKVAFVHLPSDQKERLVPASEDSVRILEEEQVKQSLRGSPLKSTAAQKSLETKMVHPDSDSVHTNNSTSERQIADIASRQTSDADVRKHRILPPYVPGYKRKRKMGVWRFPEQQHDSAAIPGRETNVRHGIPRISVLLTAEDEHDSRVKSGTVTLDDTKLSAAKTDEQRKMSGDGQSSGFSPAKRRADSKTLMPLCVMLIVFVACWLPNKICIIIFASTPGSHQDESSEKLLAATLWLLWSNSLLNPLSFLLLNKRYRVALRRTWRWVFCLKETHRYYKSYGVKRWRTDSTRQLAGSFKFQSPTLGTSSTSNHAALEAFQERYNSSP